MLALVFRSIALWMLGYPEAALADNDHALKDAREIGQAATLMFALSYVSTPIRCGNCASVNVQLDELLALADEKSAPYWKALGVTYQGCVSALTGKAADAVPMITSGLLHINQWERPSTNHSFCRLWHTLMPNLANSMMLGAALAKPQQRWKQPRKSGAKPISAEPPGTSH